MQPVSRALSLVLDHPIVTLACAAAVVFVLALHIPEFQLDASAESLTLENDRALRYYRSTTARYGGDGFLVVTYTPRTDLFSADTLNPIGRLRDELRELPRVHSVTTLLDVPLLQSPPAALSELMDEPRTMCPVAARLGADQTRDVYSQHAAPGIKEHGITVGM